MESDVFVFECGLCQKQFLTDESLLVHQRRNHRALYMYSMSDMELGEIEGEKIYNPKDVVWVKLSGMWWPAEVQDQAVLDPEITEGLKKPPLCVVQFLLESSYLHIKSLDQIYHYNCKKKMEFLKLGFKKYSKNKNEKNVSIWPDVIQEAERRTGGNPDIINDPEIVPVVEKPEVALSKPGSSGKRLSLPAGKRCGQGSRHSLPAGHFSGASVNGARHETKSLSDDRNVRSIQHTRLFLIQRCPPVDDVPQPEPQEYYCETCDLRTLNLERFIIHFKMKHFQMGRTLPPPRPHLITTGPSKPKKDKKRKEESASPIIKKKKKKSVVTNKESTPQPQKKEDPPSALEVSQECEQILKDWDDEDEEMKEGDKTSPSENMVVDENSTSQAIKESENSVTPMDNNGPPDDTGESSSKIVGAPAPPPKSSSCCFDFDDEEPAQPEVQTLKFGQKLPRVISPEKSKSSVADILSDGLELESFLNKVAVPELPAIPFTKHAGCFLKEIKGSTKPLASPAIETEGKINDTKEGALSTSSTINLEDKKTAASDEDREIKSEEKHFLVEGPLQSKKRKGSGLTEGAEDGSAGKLKCYGDYEPSKKNDLQKGGDGHTGKIGELDTDVLEPETVVLDKLNAEALITLEPSDSKVAESIKIEMLTVPNYKKMGCDIPLKSKSTISELDKQSLIDTLTYSPSSVDTDSSQQKKKTKKKTKDKSPALENTHKGKRHELKPGRGDIVSELGKQSLVDTLTYSQAPLGTSTSRKTHSRAPLDTSTPRKKKFKQDESNKSSKVQRTESPKRPETSNLRSGSRDVSTFEGGTLASRSRSSKSRGLSYSRMKGKSPSQDYKLELKSPKSRKSRHSRLEHDNKDNQDSTGKTLPTAGVGGNDPLTSSPKSKKKKIGKSTKSLEKKDKKSSSDQASEPKPDASSDQTEGNVSNDSTKPEDTSGVAAIETSSIIKEQDSVSDQNNTVIGIENKKLSADADPTISNSSNESGQQNVRSDNVVSSRLRSKSGAGNDSSPSLKSSRPSPPESLIDTKKRDAPVVAKFIEEKTSKEKAKSDVNSEYQVKVESDDQSASRLTDSDSTKGDETLQKLSENTKIALEKNEFLEVSKLMPWTQTEKPKSSVVEEHVAVAVAEEHVRKKKSRDKSHKSVSKPNLLDASTKDKNKELVKEFHKKDEHHSKSSKYKHKPDVKRSKESLFSSDIPPSKTVIPTDGNDTRHSRAKWSSHSDDRRDKTLESISSPSRSVPTTLNFDKDLHSTASTPRTDKGHSRSKSRSIESHVESKERISSPSKSTPTTPGVAKNEGHPRSKRSSHSRNTQVGMPESSSSPSKRIPKDKEHSEAATPYTNYDDVLSRTPSHDSEVEMQESSLSLKKKIRTHKKGHIRRRRSSRSHDIQVKTLESILSRSKSTIPEVAKDEVHSETATLTASDGKGHIRRRRSSRSHDNIQVKTLESILSPSKSTNPKVVKDKVHSETATSTASDGKGHIRRRRSSRSHDIQVETLESILSPSKSTIQEVAKDEVHSKTTTSTTSDGKGHIRRRRSSRSHDKHVKTVESILSPGKNTIPEVAKDEVHSETATSTASDGKGHIRRIRPSSSHDIQVKTQESILSLSKITIPEVSKVEVHPEAATSTASDGMGHLGTNLSYISPDSLVETVVPISSPSKRISSAVVSDAGLMTAISHNTEVGMLESTSIKNKNTPGTPEVVNPKAGIVTHSDEVGLSKAKGLYPSQDGKVKTTETIPSPSKDFCATLEEADEDVGSRIKTARSSSSDQLESRKRIVISSEKLEKSNQLSSSLEGKPAKADDDSSPNRHSVSHADHPVDSLSGATLDVSASSNEIPMVVASKPRSPNKAKQENNITPAKEPVNEDKSLSNKNIDDQIAGELSLHTKATSKTTTHAKRSDKDDKTAKEANKAKIPVASDQLIKQVRAPNEVMPLRRSMRSSSQDLKSIHVIEASKAVEYYSRVGDRVEPEISMEKHDQGKSVGPSEAVPVETSKHSTSRDLKQGVTNTSVVDTFKVSVVKVDDTLLNEAEIEAQVEHKTAVPLSDQPKIVSSNEAPSETAETPIDKVMSQYLESPSAATPLAPELVKMSDSVVIKKGGIDPNQTRAVSYADEPTLKASDAQENYKGIIISSIDDIKTGQPACTPGDVVGVDYTCHPESTSNEILYHSSTMLRREQPLSIVKTIHQAKEIVPSHVVQEVSKIKLATGKSSNKESTSNQKSIPSIEQEETQLEKDVPLSSPSSESTCEPENKFERSVECPKFKLKEGPLHSLESNMQTQALRSLPNNTPNVLKDDAHNLVSPSDDGNEELCIQVESLIGKLAVLPPCESPAVGSPENSAPVLEENLPKEGCTDGVKPIPSSTQLKSLELESELPKQENEIRKDSIFDEKFPSATASSPPEKTLIQTKLEKDIPLSSPSSKSTLKPENEFEMSVECPKFKLKEGPLQSLESNMQTQALRSLPNNTPIVLKDIAHNLFSPSDDGNQELCSQVESGVDKLAVLPPCESPAVGSPENSAPVLEENLQKEGCTDGVEPIPSSTQLKSLELESELPKQENEKRKDSIFDEKFLSATPCDTASAPPEKTLSQTKLVNSSISPEETKLPKVPEKGERKMLELPQAPLVTARASRWDNPFPTKKSDNQPSTPTHLLMASPTKTSLSPINKVKVEIKSGLGRSCFKSPPPDMKCERTDAKPITPDVVQPQTGNQEVARSVKVETTLPELSTTASDFDDELSALRAEIASYSESKLQAYLPKPDPSDETKKADSLRQKTAKVDTHSRESKTDRIEEMIQKKLQNAVPPQVCSKQQIMDLENSLAFDVTLKSPLPYCPKQPEVELKEIPLPTSKVPGLSEAALLASLLKGDDDDLHIQQAVNTVSIASSKKEITKPLLPVAKDGQSSTKAPVFDKHNDNNRGLSKTKSNLIRPVVTSLAEVPVVISTIPLPEPSISSSQVDFFGTSKEKQQATIVIPVEPPKISLQNQVPNKLCSDDTTTSRVEVLEVERSQPQAGLVGGIDPSKLLDINDIPFVFEEDLIEEGLMPGQPSSMHSPIVTNMDSLNTSTLIESVHSDATEKTNIVSSTAIDSEETFAIEDLVEEVVEEEPATDSTLSGNVVPEHDFTVIESNEKKVYEARQVRQISIEVFDDSDPNFDYNCSLPLATVGVSAVGQTTSVDQPPIPTKKVAKVAPIQPKRITSFTTESKYVSLGSTGKQVSGVTGVGSSPQMIRLQPIKTGKSNKNITSADLERQKVQVATSSQPEIARSKEPLKLKMVKDTKTGATKFMVKPHMVSQLSKSACQKIILSQQLQSVVKSPGSVVASNTLSTKTPSIIQINKNPVSSPKLLPRGTSPSILSQRRPVRQAAPSQRASSIPIQRPARTKITSEMLVSSSTVRLPIDHSGLILTSNSVLPESSSTNQVLLSGSPNQLVLSSPTSNQQTGPKFVSFLVNKHPELKKPGKDLLEQALTGLNVQNDEAPNIMPTATVVYGMLTDPLQQRPIMTTAVQPSQVDQLLSFETPDDPSSTVSNNETNR